MPPLVIRWQQPQNAATCQVECEIVKIFPTNKKVTIRHDDEEPNCSIVHLRWWLVGFLFCFCGAAANINAEESLTVVARAEATQ